MKLSVVGGKLDLGNIYKKVGEPDQLSNIEKKIFNLISLVIISIALVVLIFIFKSNFEVLKIFREAKISMRIERLKDGIEIYNATNGQYPENLEVITKEPDPWGKPYIYKLTDKGFILFSAGPDGIEETGDDVY